jgi:hypothetical protein
MRQHMRLWAVIASVGLALVAPLSAQAATAAAWSPQTSPSLYDYGSVPATTTAAKTFHLTNTGTTRIGPLRIILAANPGAFRKMRDTCKGKTLAPGKSCLVRITYTPAAADESDSTEVLAQNIKDTATYAGLGLTGSSPAGTPNLEITPTNGPGVYDFFSTSGTQAFTLTNNGTGAADIQLIEGGSDGPLQVDFSAQTCPATLGPGSSCNLGSMNYTAGSCGDTTYSVQLEVTWNTPTDPTDQTTGITIQAEDPHC